MRRARGIVLLAVMALTLLAVGPAAARHVPPQQAPNPGGPIPDSLDGAAYTRLEGARVSVYHVAEDALLAARMLELLEAQLPLPGLPDSLPRGVHAVLAHTPAALDALTGGVVPEWRSGVAVPALDLLVIPSGEGAGVLSGDGLRTLRHEWAHLGLEQYLDGLRIPRWFNEGYSEWASGGFDAMDVWRLRVALALGRTPSMDSLTLGWPVRRSEATTAYLLSASAVTYLVEGSGERGLRIFLERWRVVGSFEEALRVTFGVTSGQLEEDWRAHVRSRYGWLFVLGHSSVFWALLGVVLLYMVRVRRARNDEKLARLRAREGPDLPAFWVELPDGTEAPSRDPPDPLRG